MSRKARTVGGGLGASARDGEQPIQVESPDRGIEIGNPKFEGGTTEPERRIETPTERIAGFSVVNPLDIIDTGTGADQPVIRTKRKYTKRGQKEEAVSNLTALLKIERLLVTGCFFLGNLASAPELYISEAEAAEIGDALKELSKHYPIGMSEKSIAWVNLTFAVGGVFGPKVMAIYRRPVVNKPVVAKREPVASNGIPMPPMATPETAKVPSEMWPQSGDIENEE